jgi:hypothetical protein
VRRLLGSIVVESELRDEGMSVIENRGYRWEEGEGEKKEEEEGEEARRNVL